MPYKVVVTDRTAPDYEVEKQVFAETDLDLDVTYFNTRDPAEVLAVQLLKTAARNQLELAGLADELPLDEMFETFDGYAFGDIDLDELIAEPEADSEDDEDDVDELVLVEWFEPYAEADDEDEEDEADYDVAEAIDETVQA